MSTRNVASIVVVALMASACTRSAPVHPDASHALSVSIVRLVATEADGVKLWVPEDSVGPFYDDDDYSFARPTWEGRGWRVHFVYGNGGLTRFMHGARCLSRDDEAMRRKVCIGKYMVYGAMADIARASTPEMVSSMHVTIEPGGLSEAQALDIISSATTTWEDR